MTGAPSPEASATTDVENAELFDYEQIRNYIMFVLGAANRRKLLTGSIFVVVLATTLLALEVLPRTYYVETKLLAQRNQTIAALSNPGRALGWDDVPLRAATETVLRHDNLVSLVKQTDLVRRWPMTRAPLLRLKDRLLLALRGPVSDDDQLAALVGLLGVRLRVAVGDGTVTISIDWPNAGTAFELVEAAQQNFLEARHIAEISTVSEAISLLEAHALRLRAQIDTSVEQISQAAEKSAAKGAHERAVIAARRISSRPPRQAPVDPELAQIQVMLDGKRRAIKDMEEFHARRLSELQTRLAEQKSIYSDLHPAVLEVQQRIDALEKQEPTQLTALKQEERDLARDYERRRPAGATPVGDRSSLLGPLPAHILRVEREARELETDDPEVEHAKSELQFAMSKYGALLDRIDSANMELDTSRAAFKYRYSVIAPAEKPRFPVKPDKQKILIAGICAAIAVALLGATAMDIRAGRILERWQVQRQLGLEVLAEVRML